MIIIIQMKIIIMIKVNNELNIDIDDYNNKSNNDQNIENNDNISQNNQYFENFN